MNKAQAVMREIGMGILKQRKAELLSTGSVEKKDVQGRDLLTLLLKANMATDIPEDQRLTDEEVLARASDHIPQIPSLTNPTAQFRGPNIPRRRPRDHKHSDDLVSLRSL